MKTTAPVFGLALLCGSWGALASPDFDIHSPEQGYASDSDYIADPQVADRQSGTAGWYVPSEDLYDGLERAEFAAMEVRPQTSSPSEINFLPGWDPDLGEM